MINMDSGCMCTCEWLRDQLESSFQSVLILDCRPHADFMQKGHIQKAINVTLPALMLKRLVNGSLSVPAVIKCQQARDVFLQHWKSDWICLYDDADASTDSCEDHSTRIAKVFGEKLTAEGCRVVYLEGKIPYLVFFGSCDFRSRVFCFLLPIRYVNYR